VGDAVAIAPGVEWRAGAAGGYAALESSQPVAVGDGVRTDATGFAEVGYTDGSLVRLDVETEFEVVSLVDAAGQGENRVAMTVGRTWHRIGALGSAAGGYTVETAQATAAVRGTAFLVSCLVAESCDYVVIEGVVDLTLGDGTVVTVTAPATLDVTNGVASGPTPLSWDAAFADPWVLTNVDLDVQSGFADAATTFSSYGPAFGSMVGSFSGTRTVSSVTCTSYCIEGHASEADIGFEDALSLELRNDCSSGACALVGGAGIPYTFDGTAYRAQIPGVFEEGTNTCEFLPDGGEAQVTGTFSDVSDVTITPTGAEVRDGVYTVTSIDYSSIVTLTTEGHCAPIADVASFEEYMALEPYEGNTVTWTGSASR
jgi:hypothetical protein